jgi:hypothetical protein
MKDNGKKPDETKTDPKAGDGKPAGETLIKCGSCETEQKADSGFKFCPGCGEPMVKAAQAEWEATLAALSDFHKSKIDLPEKVEVEKDESALASTKDLITKAAAAGNEVDPLGEALVLGQNLNADYLRTIATETRALRRELGQFAGLFVKALSVGFPGHEERILERLVALDERVAAWEGKATKPRSVQAGVIHKNTAAENQPNGDDDEDESPRGEPLWKAAVELELAGHLEAGSATKAQMYCNRGLTLKGIIEQDAPFGRTLFNALKNYKPANAAADAGH